MTWCIWSMQYVAGGAGWESEATGRAGWRRSRVCRRVLSEGAKITLRPATARSQDVARRYLLSGLSGLGGHVSLNGRGRRTRLFL